MGKNFFLPIYRPKSQHFEPNHSIMRGKSANLKQRQSVHTKHGGIPKPRAEIGCSLGEWDEAGKRSNLYNFHCMTASVSVFGSRAWAGGFPLSDEECRGQTSPPGDCEVGHWATF